MTIHDKPPETGRVYSECDNQKQYLEFIFLSPVLPFLDMDLRPTYAPELFQVSFHLKRYIHCLEDNEQLLIIYKAIGQL